MGVGDMRLPGYSNGKRKKQRRFRTLIAVNIIVLVMLFLLLLELTLHPFGIISKPESVSASDPLLAIVNSENKVDADASISLSVLPNGMLFESSAYDALVQLLSDAKEKGAQLEVVTSYISVAEQTKLYMGGINERIAEGYDYKNAAELTRMLTDPPGESEHNTGLALDIAYDGSGVASSTDENVINTAKDSSSYKWLIKNAAKYGFILRYPEGKEEETGHAFSPWHYRYVGVGNAKNMTSRGLCLEEYRQYLIDKAAKSEK